MDWSAPLIALLGTAVGASVTLLADRIRWRRDQDQRRADTLRQTYGTYLTALHTTSEAVRAVSLGEHPPETSTASAVRAAFRSAQLNACREQVVLVASARVVRAADGTFTSLRELRDVVGSGGVLDSADYQRCLTSYQSYLRDLRNAMRADLGSPAIAEDVTF